MSCRVVSWDTTFHRFENLTLEKLQQLAKAMEDATHYNKTIEANNNQATSLPPSENTTKWKGEKTINKDTIDTTTTTVHISTITVTKQDAPDLDPMVIKHKNTGVVKIQPVTTTANKAYP